MIKNDKWELLSDSLCLLGFMLIFSFDWRLAIGLMFIFGRVHFKLNKIRYKQDHE